MYPSLSTPLLSRLTNSQAGTHTAAQRIIYLLTYLPHHLMYAICNYAFPMTRAKKCISRFGAVAELCVVFYAVVDCATRRVEMGWVGGDGMVSSGITSF